MHYSTITAVFASILSVQVLAAPVYQPSQLEARFNSSGLIDNVLSVIGNDLKTHNAPALVQEAFSTIQKVVDSISSPSLAARAPQATGSSSTSSGENILQKVLDTVEGAFSGDGSSAISSDAKAAFGVLKSVVSKAAPLIVKALPGIIEDAADLGLFARRDASQASAAPASSPSLLSQALSTVEGSLTTAIAQEAFKVLENLIEQAVPDLVDGLF